MSDKEVIKITFIDNNDQIKLVKEHFTMPYNNYDMESLYKACYVFRVLSQISILFFCISLFHQFNIPYPLGRVEGILVDGNGNFYIGLQDYGRIQKYDINGKYIKGWRIYSYGGLFTIFFDTNQNINVVTARGESLIKYDKDGELLYYHDDLPGIYEQYQTAGNNKSQYVSKKGDNYQIVDSILAPRIVKNNSIVLTQNPIYYWIIMPIIQAMIIKGLAEILLYFARKSDDSIRKDNKWEKFIFLGNINGLFNWRSHIND